MSELSFHPATRQGVKPLIGLYAESGCGKTYSALLLARGIAGPNGKVGIVDTESGRGSLYADVLPGGYAAMQLSEPFSPMRYIEAIKAAEDAGLDVLVLDSASHEWENIGGVLDMAAEREAKSGKPGLHNWKEPKLQHQKFMLKLLQSPLAIIVCVRAKFKSRQVKENGKTAIVKDDHVSPIQAEDFIFELMAHAEINPDHTIRLSKCSHPDLRGCFPEDYKEPISIKHGEAIALWASNPGKATGAQKPATGRQALKRTLCDAAKAVAGIEPAALENWLMSEELLSDNETLKEISDERMQEITAKLQKPKEVLF